MPQSAGRTAIVKTSISLLSFHFIWHGPSDQAYSQALIWCGRLQSAGQLCQTLPDGIDKLYLQAQSAWRSGDLVAYRQAVDQALQISSQAGKVTDLQTYVGQLEGFIGEAETSLEDGEPCL